MLQKVQTIINEKNKPLEKNLEFEQLQKDYKETKDKDTYDKMFVIVLQCCMNTLKKKAGHLRTDLYDMALDATLAIMNRVKNGLKNGKDYYIESLPTCCYYACIKLLYNQKQQTIDKEVSLTDLESYV